MEFYKTYEMKGTMHMNKKGKIHARVLSIALSLSVTMLNLPIHQVAHAAADTTIPEPLTAAFSIPIYIEPFHTDKYNAIDFEEYIDSEKIMDALCSCILSSRASLWTKLTLYDKLPVGEIHYRVQDDIWYNSSRYDKGGGSANSVNCVCQVKSA
jgi:hypothetical protein